MLKASTNNGMVWRRLTTLAVAAWLTGAGCLLCCGRGAQAASHARGDKAADPAALIIVETTVQRPNPARAAMQSDHSCCKAKVPVRAVQAPVPRAATATTAAPVSNETGTASARAVTASSETVTADGEFFHLPGQPSRARGCCERTSQSLDAARKPRRDAERQPTVAPVMPFAADWAGPARVYAPPPARRARPPDRGDARLLACVFLI